MDKQMLSILFDEKEEQFTGEEIAVFKRYIEENVVYSENSFEFLEENLAYYSVRYTSEHYFSPAEYFHVNSNYINSHEFQKNLTFYRKAIDWHSSTVHPEDSEYVLKKEKYLDLVDFPVKIQEFIQHLNQFPKADYFPIDLLLLINGKIYQYLPQKNFLFKWKNNTDIAEILKEENYFSFVPPDENWLSEEQHIVLLPIFVPVRKMLFLGEAGYKSSLIDYGKLLERLGAYFTSIGQKHEQINYFDTYKVQELLHLDGVERSISTIVLMELSIDNGGW